MELHPIEREGPSPVAGVDEAGRGPAAGPVVAAAVVFLDQAIPAGLGDSKALTLAQRERAFDAIMSRAAVGVGVAEPEEIDRVNLLQATLRAMVRAIDALPVTPNSVLIDGDKAPSGPWAIRTVIGGDGLCVSIAAASIIAKVTRDRLMQEADLRWPGYGFCQHVGYVTPAHKQALSAIGACPIHRRRFAPVRQTLAR